MNTGEIIPFISSKSGVGKTTSIINIGSQLASLGYSVCIVDMDIFFGELHMLMKLEQFYDNSKTLCQLIKNKCTLDECLIYSNDNLCILPSSRNLNVNINVSKLIDIINSLKDKFDYILLDLPFDFSTTNIFENNQMDISKIVLISTHNLSSIINTDSLIEYFELKSISDNMSLIITNYIDELNSSNEDLSLSNINDVLKIPLLGTVSYNMDMILSSENLPPNKKSTIYKEYEVITQRLLTNSHTESDLNKSKNKKFLSNNFFKKQPKKITIHK